MLVKENEIVFIAKKNYRDIIHFLNENSFSKKYIKSIYRKKLFSVNSFFRRKGLPIFKGDKVSIVYEEEFDDIIPLNKEIQIEYEDEVLLIIQKKPGIMVHRSRKEQKKSLENKVKYYFKKKEINRKVRFVNRLDKDTEGLIIVAKNPYIDALMSNKIANKKISRKYLLIVEGNLKEKDGIISLPILKDEGKMRRRVSEDGKKAITKYRVLEEMKEKTLVEAELITGRGHQLRVHFSSIGHPIEGDKLYGSSNNTEDLKLSSYYLSFNHPLKNRKIILKINPSFIDKT